jgi:hypothetical protein
MITSTHTVNLDGAGPVDVTVSESGQGRPFLMLHGGGGPEVARFGETLAAAEHVRVLTPTIPVSRHPGPRRCAASGVSPRHVALLTSSAPDDDVIGNLRVDAAEIAIPNSPRQPGHS